MIDRAAGRDLSGAGRTYRGHTGAMAVSYTHLTLPTNREV